MQTVYQMSRLRKTPLMLHIEARDPRRRDIETILRETYREQKTLKKTADELGMGFVLVWRWMRRLGLEIREERTVRRRRRS